MPESLTSVVINIISMGLFGSGWPGNKRAVFVYSGGSHLSALGRRRQEVIWLGEERNTRPEKRVSQKSV